MTHSSDDRAEKGKFLSNIFSLKSWKEIPRRDKTYGSFLALIVGIVVAYGAITFRDLIYIIQDMMLGSTHEDILNHTANLPWWKILLSTVSGGIAISLIYRFLMNGKTAQSISEVIEANALSHGSIPARQGIISAVTAAVALGSGSAAGREGPVVHLGATLSSWIARRLHLSQSMSRTILGCGVAAAISASFNAPLAGVFFALEVILGHYALHAFAPIVISSVTAAIISHIHMGDFPAFIIPDYHISTFWQFPSFLLLGIICAFAAITLIKSIFLAEDVANKLPIEEWMRPPIGALAVGILAIFSPFILGYGYGATDATLKEMIPLGILFYLIILKIAATALSLAFRYGTGIFSPSLFLGAIVGGAFGFIATALAAQVSEIPISYGLYAIVGMGAVSSAVLGAPISTILIIFEMTGDYQITLALMAAVVVSNLMTRHFLGSTSFFHMQLARRGLDLEGGRARHLMKNTKVASLMDNTYVTLDSEASVEEVRDLLLDQQNNTVFVTDPQEALVGRISFSDLRRIYRPVDDGESPPTQARHIMRPLSLCLSAEDTLETAFEYFDNSGEDNLPVIRDQDRRTIIGIIHSTQVLRAYNAALIEEKE